MNCSGGSYCKGGGSEPDGLCEPATFCDENSINRFAKDSGESCPPGKCCPEGTETPVNCALNSYTNEPIDCTGVNYCLPCPAGKQCLDTDGTVVPDDCGIKYFCEEGVSPKFCADGTYGNKTGLASQEECDICPTGFYCKNGEIVGECEEGYYCSSGSGNEKPSGIERVVIIYFCVC